MSDNKTLKNFWLKLDMLLGMMTIAALFCLIFVLAHRAIYDPDIWLHLKTGELIIKNRAIPSKDIFSFTVAGRPWVDHSWLFQVISYIFYAKWNAEGLISLQAYAIILVFFILFVIGYKSLGSYLESAALVLFAAYGTTVRFNIRPDIFTLLFFIVYLYFLRFHIEKRKIWLLLVIQIIWVNMHGYFILGPLLIILFIFAEFLRRRVKFLPWAWEREFILNDGAYRRLKRLFLFAMLINLINPRFIEGMLYPLGVFGEVISGSNKIFFKHIQELQPTFSMFNSLWDPYNMMLLLCVLVMLINIKKLKIIDILLIIFFFPFSLTVRNAPFLLFIAYIITVGYIGQAVRKISSNIEFRLPSKHNLFYLSKCGFEIIFIFWLIIKIDQGLLIRYYDFESREIKSALLDIAYKNYPTAPVDFILSHHLGPNILNDFNSGAYLIGRGYPKVKVFIDGRTELYGKDFFEQYQQIIKGNVSVFEKVIDDYDLNVILFSMTSTDMPQIVSYIYKNPMWKLVFFDDSAVVFVKDIPSNKELIKKYTIDLHNYSAPKMNIIRDLGLQKIYPRPYIKRASLLDILKEDAAVISECTEALRILPDCGKAYHFLGRTYLRKELYREALDNLHSAVLLMPTDVEGRTDLGVCLKDLKENQLAIDILKKSIRINKRYAPIYYHLGSIYLDLKNEDEAITFLHKAIIYAPEEPVYHFKLGEAFYEKVKKYRDTTYLIKAEGEFKTASRLNITDDKDLNKKIQDRLKEIATCVRDPI